MFVMCWRAVKQKSNQITFYTICTEINILHLQIWRYIFVIYCNNQTKMAVIIWVY